MRLRLGLGLGLGLDAVEEHSQLALVGTLALELRARLGERGLELPLGACLALRGGQLHGLEEGEGEG